MHALEIGINKKLKKYKSRATKNVGRLEQEVTVFSSASVKARRDNSVVVLHMFFRSVPLFFVLIHVFFEKFFCFSCVMLLCCPHEKTESSLRWLY